MFFNWKLQRTEEVVTVTHILQVIIKLIAFSQIYVSHSLTSATSGAMHFGFMVWHFAIYINSVSTAYLLDPERTAVIFS